MHKFAAGNGNLLVFTDSTLSTYVADTLFRRETYSTAPDTCWYCGSSLKILPRLRHANATRGLGAFIEQAADTLTLYYGPVAADGYTLRYERMQ